MVDDNELSRSSRGLLASNKKQDFKTMLDNTIRSETKYQHIWDQKAADEKILADEKAAALQQSGGC